MSHQPRRTVVFIEWMDTTVDTDAGWQPAEGFQPQLAVAFTVGFLLHEDAETVTLVQSSVIDQDKKRPGELHWDQEDIDLPITIPKVLIKRRKDMSVQLSDLPEATELPTTGLIVAKVKHPWVGAAGREPDGLDRMTRVEVQFRDGGLYSEPRCVYEWHWGHIGSAWDIIAWRLAD